MLLNKINRISLKIRLIGIFTAILIISGGTISYSSITIGQQELLAREYDLGGLLVSSKTDLLQQSLTTLDGEVRLLAYNSTLNSYLDEPQNLGNLAEYWYRVFTQYPDAFGRACLLDDTEQERFCIVNPDAEHIFIQTEGLKNQGQRHDIESILQQASKDQPSGRLLLAKFDAVESPSGLFRPILHYDAVVRGDNNETVRAIVSVEIRLDNVFSVLDTNDQDTTFSVIDANTSEYLYGAPATKDLFGITRGTGITLSTYQPDSATLIVQNQRGVLTNSLDKPNFIQLYEPVHFKDLKWIVLYSRSLASFVQQTQQLEFNVFGLGCLAIAIASMAIWGMTHRTLQPLDVLKGIALKIAESSDYSMRVEKAGGSPELAALSRAFNKMLDTISYEIDERKIAQKAAEKAKKEAQHQAFGMEQATRVVTLITSIADVFTLVNRIEKIISEIFGYSTYIFLVQEDGAFSSNISDDMLSFIKQALKDYTLDGDRIAIPLVWDGEIKGVFCVVGSDQLEEFDLKLFAILARQISVVIENAELYTKQVKLAEIKDVFLTNMSHEFRLPLAVIASTVEVLIENIEDAPLTNFQQKGLQTILDGEVRLAAMVEDCLDLSKIQAGQTKVELKRIGVKELCDEIQTGLENLASKKGLYLHVQIAPDAPDTVVTDIAKIRTIATNLIGNAIKFTHNGGVRVLISPSDNSCWQIIVSDTGIGIPGEYLDKIFDKFYQIDSSDKRVFQGAGIGLALTKKWVEILGGTIHVQSELGKGSTFAVVLPKNGLAE